MAQLKNNPIALDNTTKLFGVNNNVPGEVVPGFLGIHNLLHVQDRKAAGAAGGTFTSGAWRTRDLNTVVANNISGASLATNQVTLPAGTYFVEGMASAFGVAGCVSRLYNTTASAVLLTGNALRSTDIAGSLQVNVVNVISGVFTLAGSSVVELQHVGQQTYATNGFGLCTDLGQAHNIYSDLKIWKLA
jgi:hypothetical protein